MHSFFNLILTKKIYKCISVAIFNFNIFHKKIAIKHKGFWNKKLQVFIYCFFLKFLSIFIVFFAIFADIKNNDLPWGSYIKIVTPREVISPEPKAREI